MKVTGQLKTVVTYPGVGIFRKGSRLSGDLDGSIIWVTAPRTGKKLGIPVSDWRGIEAVEEAPAAAAALPGLPKKGKPAPKTVENSPSIPPRGS